MDVITGGNMYRFILMFLLIACSQEQASKIQVVNGVITNDYPAIVKMSIAKGGSNFMCTGTFIRHDLLLTAAHCVKGASYVNVNGKRSLKIFANKKYNDNSYDWVSYDQALVKFPQNTSFETLSLSKEPLENNDELLMVGYGLNDYEYNSYNRTWIPSNKSSSGVKREGTNVYKINSDLDSQGVIRFAGRAQNTNGRSGDGSNVSLGQGDSGGPLIVPSKGIVGIASGQYLPDSRTNVSAHNYVLSKYAVQFFKEARAVGMFDGIDLPDEDVNTVPDNGSPKPPTAPDNSSPKGFDFKGVGEDGVYSIKFVNIPKDYATIQVFWGQDGSYVLDEIKAPGKKEAETESAWGFGDETVIKIKAFDKKGKLLKTLVKDIAR